MAENRTIVLDGDFAGWKAEIRSGVSARILLDLQSALPSKVLPAFAALVVSHNFKGINGEEIADILDAPVEALTELMTQWAKGNQLDPK
jgi:DNA-directed RNA polymerase specialized sigma24 family protein